MYSAFRPTLLIWKLVQLSTDYPPVGRERATNDTRARDVFPHVFPDEIAIDVRQMILAILKYIWQVTW